MVAESPELDWVSRFADEVIAEAERARPGKPIVCASGLSPSGPIHLGNLREVMTPHLVADEIRRRGHDVRHLHLLGRLRPVPQGAGAGVDPSWAEHIGKPLTSVPAPAGSRDPNWAEHFKAPMIEALAELGVEYDGDQPDRAVHLGRLPRADPARDARARRHRRDPRPVPDQEGRPAEAAGQKPVDEAELEAAEGSGAAAEDDGSVGGRVLPVQAVLRPVRARTSPRSPPTTTRPPS